MVGTMFHGGSMNRISKISALLFTALAFTLVFMDTAFGAEPPKLVSLGQFNPSFYWIALEKDDGQARDQDLYDVDGNRLVSVSAKFLKELKMEGTGRLLDGRLINFKARVQKPDGTFEIRWRWCGPEAPYGYGYEDYLLRAFRSLAVDATVIPLGSRIYIPAVVGAKLPDGTVHDGFFEAIDIGSAIVNKRIDVFTSFGDQSSVFRKVGFQHGKMTEIFLVKE